MKDRKQFTGDRTIFNKEPSEKDSLKVSLFFKRIFTYSQCTTVLEDEVLLPCWSGQEPCRGVGSLHTMVQKYLYSDFSTCSNTNQLVSIYIKKNYHRAEYWSHNSNTHVTFSMVGGKLTGARKNKGSIPGCVTEKTDLKRLPILCKSFISYWYNLLFVHKLSKLYFNCKVPRYIIEKLLDTYQKSYLGIISYLHVAFSQLLRYLLLNFCYGIASYWWL